MSTHVDESVPTGPSEPSGSSEDVVDPGDPSASTGSEWVRAEMLRRMAANRSTRGRHARRGEPPAPPPAEQASRGTFPNGVRPARRRTDAPPPWAAPAPAASAADMPENYVPRHSVVTPGPAADPVEPGSGPILVVRPAGATADGARDAGEPDRGVGPIGGPSLPPTGLPIRRRRGGGPGTPLQADAAPVAEPWLRPGPVVPHEPARRLGAPPDVLGAAEPIPAWGLPLASPPRGFAMPALPETAAGRAPRTAAAEPVAPVLDLEVAPAGGLVAEDDHAPAADAAVDDTAADDTALDDVAPADLASDDVAPADLASDDVAPADPASDDVAPADLASDDVASDDVADVHAAADETATEDVPVAAEVVERDAADGVDVGTEDDADPTSGRGRAGGPTPTDAPVPPGAAASGGGPTGTAAPITGAGRRGPQRPNGAGPGNGASPSNEAGPANGGVRVHAPVPALAHSAGANDGAAHPSGSVDVRVLPTATAPAAAPGPVAAPAALPGETPAETTDEIAGGISDTPTAPHPIVRARRAALSGRAAGVPAQRATVEPARALTPRPAAPHNIPVVGTAPPEPGSTRVRVVLSERKGVARPVRTIKEVQEGTAVGELLRRDLIQSQLLVTARFAVLTVVVLGALPAVFALLPEVSRFHVLGVRLPWLLLGVLMYPFLVAVAWRYTRVADRVEQNFADHVQD